MHEISVDLILQDQREKLGKLGYEAHEILTKKIPVPDEISTAFIQHELKKTVCSTKGWIMSNYPSNSHQFAQFLKLRNEPFIVVFVVEDPAEFRSLESDCLIDQEAGTVYSEWDSQQAKVKEHLKNHTLIKPSEAQRKSLQQAANEYHKVLEVLNKEWTQRLVKVAASACKQTDGQALHDLLHRTLFNDRFYS